MASAQSISFHEAFGSFVVGGNYIIGTVIFLVLIAIQYVVINHGAVRISEVTARFIEELDEKARHDFKGFALV